jgi:hypothetical protein
MAATSKKRFNLPCVLPPDESKLELVEIEADFPYSGMFVPA